MASLQEQHGPGFGGGYYGGCTGDGGGVDAGQSAIIMPSAADVDEAALNAALRASEAYELEQRRRAFEDEERAVAQALALSLQDDPPPHGFDYASYGGGGSQGGAGGSSDWHAYGTAQVGESSGGASQTASIAADEEEMVREAIARSVLYARAEEEARGSSSGDVPFDPPPPLAPHHAAAQPQPAGGYERQLSADEPSPELLLPDFLR